MVEAEIHQRIKNYKKFFNEHAELGFMEKETSSFIEKKLSEAGFLIKRIIGSTGIVAILNNNENKHNVVFRAEMDAMKLPDGTIKHICGHDAHMAIMLVLAEEISRKKDRKISIKFIFQPAEEICNGAKLMIKNIDLFDGEKNFIYGIHMWSELKTGFIAINNDELMAGGGQFLIKIAGETSHAAFPHEGIDCSIVCSEVINELQYIISRQLNPNDNCVITIGSIHGGENDNQLIPEIIITGTIRYYSSHIKNAILKRIKQICQSKIVKWKVDIEFDFKEKVSPLINNKEIVSLTQESIKKVFEKEKIISNYQTMAVDDFSEYLTIVPGAYFLIGCNDEKFYPQHHPNFYVSDDALDYAYLLVEEIYNKNNNL